MKRYKLLKDLPTFKAGDEFRLEKSGLWKDKGERIPIIAYAATTLEKFPNIIEDWFEEIPEQPKTVWDLEKGDKCWFIASDDKTAYISYFRWDSTYRPEREIGDIFLTEKEAERELARRKAKQILLRDTKGFKPDWTDDSQDRFCVSFYLFCGSRTKGHLGHLQVGNAKYSITREIYFATQADAEASINAHEKEWKIYLGVEE